MTNSPTAYLYMHTHWDREWYLPFEVYRSRLLSVVRSVVEHLQSGDLPSFLLDGQSSVLEDVLEIDPDLRESLSKLIRAGTLSAGPWYVLADQMLVCGESLIRNLQYGIKSTAAFGPPAMVGYCPDTFGHSVDLPRILLGFNIDNAYVWRGVPKLDSGPAFWWQSPDGSRVLAYHLSRGYYRSEFHNVTSPEEVYSRVSGWLNPADSHFCPGLNGVLVPVGGDHMSPPKALTSLLHTTPSNGSKSGGAASNVPPIKFINLTEFTTLLKKSIPARSLPSVITELRDNSASAHFERAYLLQGVLSSRLYLKRSNRIAEHRLISIVEPYFSYLALAGVCEYPALELQHAWKLLMQNHPHDSICGCSIDSVHQEMQSRTIRLHQTLNALDAEAVRALCHKSDNPLAAVGDAPLLDPNVKTNCLQLFNLSSSTVAAPISFSWTTAEKVKPQVFTGDDLDAVSLQIDSSKVSSEIFCGAGEEPLVKNVFVHKGWVWPEALPSFGRRFVEWPRQDGISKKKSKTARPPVHAATIEARRVSNEFLSLEVEPDGTLVASAYDSRRNTRVFRIGHIIRDVADCGDTYNFDPLPGDRPLVATLTTVAKGKPGPLVASLLLNYELAIPECVDESETPVVFNGVADSPAKFRRNKKVAVHKFVVEVSLRRGVPILFFDMTWTNKSRDHRLEVVFDTGLEVSTTYSENHFCLVKRENKRTPVRLPVAKGEEAPLDRYPCQRFFIANGQAFLNTGLPEYAVDKSTVSITVLRGVSGLNRPRLQTRGGGAGPSVPTPEANSLGQNTVSYGWAPLSVQSGTQLDSDLADKDRVHAYALAELYEGRCWANLSTEDKVGTAESLMSIDNPAIRLVACYIDNATNCLFMRFLNTIHSSSSATVKFSFPMDAVSICKLNEQTISDLVLRRDEKGAEVRLKCGNNELVTLKVQLPVVPEN